MSVVIGEKKKYTEHTTSLFKKKKKINTTVKNCAHTEIYIPQKKKKNSNI